MKKLALRKKVLQTKLVKYPDINPTLQPLTIGLHLKHPQQTLLTLRNARVHDAEETRKAHFGNNKCLCPHLFFHSSVCRDVYLTKIKNRLPGETPLVNTPDLEERQQT